MQATLSDSRVKTNVTDLSEADALAFVEGLRPRTFEYSAYPGMLQQGFIAQEILTAAQTQTLPVEFCVPGSGGYDLETGEGPIMAVHYHLLVPALTKVIQDLMARVTALEALQNQ